MDSKLIQSQNRDDIPPTQHRVFRGIMLGFLLSIIVAGSVSIVSAQVTTPGGGVPGSNPFVEEQIREIFQVDVNEDVTLPTDGFSYALKRIGEGFTEFFTFDRIEKEKVNADLIDERAKEIAILDARGVDIPDDVVKNYSDRIQRAERFVHLQTTENDEIDARKVVRERLEAHKVLFLDKISALSDQPSNTRLTQIVSEFGDKIDSIVMRIDADEVAIVKNTIPIIQERKMVLMVAEMQGDVELVKTIMADLEEIDDKLNRLHLADFCISPIKTLQIATFEDIAERCPLATLMEDEIRAEFDSLR